MPIWNFSVCWIYIKGDQTVDEQRLDTSESLDCPRLGKKREIQSWIMEKIPFSKKILGKSLIYQALSSFWAE